MVLVPRRWGFRDCAVRCFQLSGQTWNALEVSVRGRRAGRNRSYRGAWGLPASSWHERAQTGGAYIEVGLSGDSCLQRVRRDCTKPATLCTGAAGDLMLGTRFCAERVHQKPTECQRPLRSLKFPCRHWLGGNTKKERPWKIGDAGFDVGERRYVFAWPWRAWEATQEGRRGLPPPSMEGLVRLVAGVPDLASAAVAGMRRRCPCNDRRRFVGDGDSPSWAEFGVLVNCVICMRC